MWAIFVSEKNAFAWSYQKNQKSLKYYNTYIYMKGRVFV